MDKTTLTILRLYSERASLSLKDLSVLADCSLQTFSSQVHWLFEEGYLEVSDVFHPEGEMYTVSTQLRITQKGRNYLSEYSRKNKDHIINEVRAWITLAIALAAFVLSVINHLSLIGQSVPPI